MDAKDNFHPVPLLTIEDLFYCTFEQEPLSEEVRRHLEQCAICREQLAQYTRMHTFLQSSLYRDHCPSREKLGSLCRDRVSKGEGLVLEAHLRECLRCATAVEEIRKVLTEGEGL